MERLQVAIQKAREQRENRAQGAAAPQQEPEEAQVAEAAEVVQADGPAAEASADEMLARWEGLTELTLNRRRLQRARIVTLRAGATSAPFDDMVTVTRSVSPTLTRPVKGVTSSTRLPSLSIRSVTTS